MGSKVIVTGASGNVGGAIIEKLRVQGKEVMGLVGSPRGAERLRENGFVPFLLDLADEAAVEKFVAAHASEATAAVFTAGGYAPGSFNETHGDGLKEMFRINFETAYFLVRALLPVFEKNGFGQMFFLGARPALNPSEGIHALGYAMAKRGIFYLAELVNAYGEDKNITATVIVPSTIDTPRNREAMPEADFKGWVSPSAIADSIGFLLTDSGKQVREGILKLYNQA